MDTVTLNPVKDSKATRIADRVLELMLANPNVPTDDLVGLIVQDAKTGHIKTANLLRNKEMTDSYARAWINDRIKKKKVAASFRFDPPKSRARGPKGLNVDEARSALAAFYDCSEDDVVIDIAEEILAKAA